ncbi:hypothetical protein BGZ60DRAFT_497958 [Tricladium varicosporioides]|nr:hypothetical protein BGZ60DRAFT_497958 [Hymenoscyphus varicosporioides]
MTSDPVFRNYDMALARRYWYLIAGAVVAITAFRLLEALENRLRLRRHYARSTDYPTRPQNAAAQVYATVTAIGRELSYPQVFFKGPFSWLSLPPLGKVLSLLCYWAVVTYLLTYKATIDDENYYERIGFRAAWMSITQVPLVYLLASKSSLIGQLVGSSHERLNWLHRWVSRTLLVCVTIHGGFFMREWMLGGIVKLELWMMPMVTYGLGGWAILVWTFLTSLHPIRRMAYELFVLQHIASATVFLWLLWKHVPEYAMYNVWFAIAALSFDCIYRGVLLCLRNIHTKLRRIGYEAEFSSRGKDITVITIDSTASFTCSAGQHVYLWIPRLGPFETHPFTIATTHSKSKSNDQAIEFAVRAQSGFSKRINQYTTTREARGETTTLRAFIAGPYGSPPNWKAYETLILLCASTGASFTLPVLESILDSANSSCVRRISFLLLAREENHVEYYERRLVAALTRAHTVGIELRVEIAITGNDDKEQEIPVNETGQGISTSMIQTNTSDDNDGITSLSSPTEQVGESNTYVLVGCRSHSHSPSSSTSSVQTVIRSRCRPVISEWIRDPIERTGGETTIAVCGGKELVADVRNSVARLSDERAVHKGTGAQGLHLYVEEYCF